MRVRLIVNPIAGRGKGPHHAETLGKALERRGVQVETAITQTAGDGERFAAQPDIDGVVAMGGDGTVNEVINGLAREHTWMTIMPLGTANAVARELEIPREPEAMADLIAERRIRAIDTGIHNGKRFLLGAGAGYDAAVVGYVHRRRRGRLSLAHYALPAVRLALTYPFPPIKVTVDGLTLSEKAEYVIVGNSRYTGGIFPLTPEARLADGKLDVCVLRDLGFYALARLALTSHRPGFVVRPEVLYTKGTDIVLEAAAADQIPLHVDGDPCGALPAHFTVEPGSLRIIAP